MKEKYYIPHFMTAIAWAKMSYARRRKVGAVLAREEHVLSTGYNGTLPGEDNACEILVPDYDENGNQLDPVWVTHGDVIHAEKNCLVKMMYSHETSEGATMFVTLAPCKNCALDIVLAKVKEVFYLEDYRDMSGVEFLEKRGIPCKKFILEEQ